MKNDAQFTFQISGIYSTSMAVTAASDQLYYDNIYQERYMRVPWKNEQNFIEGSPITYAKNLQTTSLVSMEQLMTMTLSKYQSAPQ